MGLSQPGEKVAEAFAGRGRWPGQGEVLIAQRLFDRRFGQTAKQVVRAELRAMTVQCLLLYRKLPGDIQRELNLIVGPARLAPLQCLYLSHIQAQRLRLLAQRT
ncbi:MAG: hypothetical protein C4310_13485, partial [Chloroflexota bacterium]